MDNPIPPPFSAHQLHQPPIFNSSQPDVDLEVFQFDPALDAGNAGSIANSFDAAAFAPQSGQPPRFQALRSNASFPPDRPYELPDGSDGHGREETRQQGPIFGVLTSQQPLNGQGDSIEQYQNEIDLRPRPVTGGGTTQGHFSDMKMVPNPPDLDEWRRKLFDVDEVITMTEDEFQTYFPHVDNIYSHRSTQKYKRKPFVSHYWDCRLKGRPPGTAKSDDPNKKKRKRHARERDQCDVKIKITEFFPGARALLNQDEASHETETDIPSGNGTALPGHRQSQEHQSALPGSDGARFYTIQRVNGNGANGKTDTVTGGHRHSIEESDRIKKNSIYRHFLKKEKEDRKTTSTQSTQKTYHKRATGAALATVKRHSKEHPLKLYGSCFCPFVQRVWIALEAKGMEYQYIEVDPYAKPASLMALNPRGLVPALQHGDWSSYESSVLMEYLEDTGLGTRALLPTSTTTGASTAVEIAQKRAHCRLWADHINRKILPQFYALLQSQSADSQASAASTLQEHLTTLLAAADPTGPFFQPGRDIGFVDIVFAPWMLRFSRVLKPYRGWPDPQEGSRWKKWVDAVEQCEAVRATTSEDRLYVESYERYAENRPGTSQVAEAVNRGLGLP